MSQIRMRVFRLRQGEKGDEYPPRRTTMSESPGFKRFMEQLQQMNQAGGSGRGFSGPPRASRGFGTAGLVLVLVGGGALLLNASLFNGWFCVTLLWWFL
jgi:hypothetical protein